MSSHIRLPEIFVTNPAGPVRRAPWMERLDAEVATTEDLRRYRGANAVVVVQSKDVTTMLKRPGLLRVLADKHSVQGSRVIFSFSRSVAAHPGKAPMEVLLSKFPRFAEIEVAGPGAGVELAVQAAVAKSMLQGHEPPRPRAHQDPLAQVRSVIAATAKLRSESGRLDAEKIARLFGIAIAELASHAEKSRQAVSKTPDAPSLQKTLRPYERIARLGAMLEESEFRAWLNQPSEQLEGQTPLELVRAGKAADVADFAEDVLTGAPA